MSVQELEFLINLLKVFTTRIISAWPKKYV